MTVRTRIWWKTAAATGLLVFVAAMALTLASASQLMVTAGTASRANVLHKCASQTLTAAPAGASSGGSYSSVQISGIAAACQGISTTIELRSSTGALLASGTVTPSATTATLTTGTYTAASVTAAVVKVGGWLFRPTWQPPVAVPALSCVPVNNGGNVVQGAGQSCTVTLTSIGGWISYPGAWGVGAPYYHYSFNFTVASSQPNWQVTVNFADTATFPLYNAVPVYVGSGYNIVKAPSYSCSALPIFVGRKAAGPVSGQDNAVMYVTSAPGSPNGTAQLCP